MKAIFSILFVFCVFSSCGQYYSFEYDTEFIYYEWFYFGNQSKEKIKNNKIRSYREYHEKYKKGMPVKKSQREKRGYTEYKYDSCGNCIEYLHTNKKGEKTKHSVYVYNERNQITSYLKYNRRGTVINKRTNAYERNGKNTESILYRRGGEDIKTHYVSKYDSSKITERYEYKGNKNKLRRKWIYSYYPDGKQEKTTLYKRSGKIKYTWLFDCDDKKKLEAPLHKDTTTICISKEINSDGSYTIINQFTDDKKRIRKTISTYNKDSVLIKNFNYDYKDRPVFQVYYLPEKKYFPIESFYYNKGKPISHYIYEYNKNLDQISRTYFRYKSQEEKIWNKNIYTYDTKGNMTESTYYNKHNEISGKTTFEYVFY